MRFLQYKRSYSVAALFAAVTLCVGLAPIAHAAGVSDMLVCVSDQNAPGFGCGTANSYVVADNGGTFTGTGTGSASGSFTQVGSPVIGVNFSAVVGQFTSTGTGVFNSPGDAQDFNTFDFASTGAGTVYLVLATDNYTGGNPFSILAELDLGPGVASVTDTLCYEGGSGGFEYCAGDPANTIGTATITASGPLSITGNLAPTGSPFGLQQDIAITFSAAGTFSGDFPVRAAPEPTSILLFSGAALLAFGAIRRKMQLS